MVDHLKKAMDFEYEGDIDAAIKEAKQAMKADSSSSRPGTERKNSQRTP